MRITLSIPLFFYNDKPLVIRNICTDSREVESGDLFIPLAKNSSDAAAHTSEAISRGALLYDDIFPNSEPYNGINALASLCSKYLALLPKLRHRGAITGSVGKSTTTAFLRHFTESSMYTHGTYENYNNIIGASLSALMAPKDTMLLISELGMNHAGEISRMSQILRPTFGIITNIGTSHIGLLGSRENIARAKMEICDGMDNGTVICPAEEVLLNGLAGRLGVSFTDRHDPRAEAYCRIIRSDAEHSVFDLFSPFGNLSHAVLPLGGEHIARCAALAAVGALLLGVSENDIISSLGRIKENKATENNLTASLVTHQKPHQQEYQNSESVILRRRIHSIGDITVIDDSYNASLESIEADMKYLAGFADRPLGAMLGDVRELGNESKRIHETIGSLAHKYGIIHLYLYGKHAIDMARGAVNAGFDSSHIYVNSCLNKPHISAEQISTHHSRGELILFKASHKTELTHILRTLYEMHKNRGNNKND